MSGCAVWKTENQAEARVSARQPSSKTERLNRGLLLRLFLSCGGNKNNRNHSPLLLRQESHVCRQIRRGGCEWLSSTRTEGRDGTEMYGGEGGPQLFLRVPFLNRVPAKVTSNLSLRSACLMTCKELSKRGWGGGARQELMEKATKEEKNVKMVKTDGGQRKTSSPPHQVTTVWPRMMV